MFLLSCMLSPDSVVSTPCNWAAKTVSSAAVVQGLLQDLAAITIKKLINPEPVNTIRFPQHSFKRAPSSADFVLVTAQQSEPDLLLNTTGLHGPVTTVWHGWHSHEADSFDNDFVIGRKPVVQWRQIYRIWQRYIPNTKWVNEYLAGLMCGPMRGSDGRVEKVVCAGGWNGNTLKTVEVYDLKRDSWSTGKFLLSQSSLHFHRHQLSATLELRYVAERVFLAPFNTGHASTFMRYLSFGCWQKYVIDQKFIFGLYDAFWCFLPPWEDSKEFMRKSHDRVWTPAVR